MLGEGTNIVDFRKLKQKKKRKELSQIIINHLLVILLALCAYFLDKEAIKTHPQAYNYYSLFLFPSLSIPP